MIIPTKSRYDIKDSYKTNNHLRVRNLFNYIPYLLKFDTV